MSKALLDHTRQVIAVLIACYAVVSPNEAAAQRGATGVAQEPIELVLDDLPLGDVVKAIAERTGTDYIFEPPLPGRVTVAIPSRVTTAEATEILNAALLIKGFVAIPIAPSRYVITRWEKMAGSAPYTESELDSEAEGAVTTRIQLRYANPDAVARALHPLLQAKAQAIPYLPSGSLILAGTENRIARLIEIARELDFADRERMIVRRLRYREASEVRDQLQALFDRQADAGERAAKLDATVDERTNALLLTGNEADLAQLSEWIDIMDVPAASGGEIHVVHLIHQNPEELATLLESQSGSQAQRRNNSNARPDVESGPLIGKDYSVVAHPATRSLVIRADRTTFDSLRFLIGKLDREPRMVRVDVNIFEIATDGNVALGAGGVIPAIEPKAVDDLGLVALLNPGLLDLPNVLPGFNFGNSPLLANSDGPTFTVSGEDTVIPILDDSGNLVLGPGGIPQAVIVPGLGVTLISQEVYAEVEVKQRPSIVVEVGQEAELFIGDNIPIPVGSADEFDPQFGPTIGVNIQREDIGVLIRVKPIVSNEGDLQLDLDLELDAATGLASAELGPVLTSRALNTSFAAGFGQRMIIAGLDSESIGSIETRIPFLSAIPFFGQFFTASLDTTRRRYLLYSVQAHPVPTSEEQQARDVSLARAITRLDTGLEAQDGARYAIRAASYYKRDMAEAAASELDVEPWSTTIHRRETEDGERFDLFVVGLQRMADVALTSLTLEKAGLRPEIVTLASGSTAVR